MAAVSEYQAVNPLTKHVLFGSGYPCPPLRSSIGVVYHLAPPRTPLWAIIGRRSAASQLEKFPVCCGESLLKVGDFFVVFVA